MKGLTVIGSVLFCLFVCLFVGFFFGGGVLYGYFLCVSCFSCLIASMCFSKLIKLKKDVTVKL